MTAHILQELLQEQEQQLRSCEEGAETYFTQVFPALKVPAVAAARSSPLKRLPTVSTTPIIGESPSSHGRLRPGRPQSADPTLHGPRRPWARAEAAGRGLVQAPGKAVEVLDVSGQADFDAEEVAHLTRLAGRMGFRLQPHRSPFGASSPRWASSSADSAALSARGYRHPLLGKASPGSPAAPAAELLRHAADRTALLAIARDTLRGLLDADSTVLYTVEAGDRVDDGLGDPPVPAQGPVGQALRSKLLVTVHRPAAALPAADRPPDPPDPAAHLCVPVLAPGSDVVLAVASVARHNPNSAAFSPEEQGTLTGFALSLGLCLAHSAVVAELAAVQRRLQTLVATAQGLTERPINDTHGMRRVLEEARAACGADHLLLYRLDGADVVLDSAARCEACHALAVALQPSVSQAAGTVDPVVLVGDSAQDSRLKATKRHLSSPSAAVCCPVGTLGGSTLVAQLARHGRPVAPPVPFTAAEQQTVRLFAAVAALSWLRGPPAPSPSFGPATGPSDALLALAHAVVSSPSKELPDLLDEVVDRARLLIGASVASLRPADPLSPLLQSSPARPPSGRLSRPPRTLLVPVVHAGETVGTVVFEDKLDVNGRSLLFSPIDEVVVGPLMTLVGWLLPAWRATEAIATARQRLATVAGVFQRVSQSGLNLEPFAAEVVRGAQQCSGAAVAALAWVDAVRGELDVVWVGPGEPQREPLRLPLAEGVVGLVARSGQPVRLEDAPQHPAFSRSVDLRAGSQTRGLIALPVWREGAVAAVLNVRTSDVPFTDLEYDVLASLAALASFVLSTKHTFWTSRILTGQATATLDVLAAAPVLGPHGMLALAAQRLAAMLGADIGRAWLVDWQTTQLEDADGPDAGLRRPLSGLAGRAVHTAQPVNVPNAAAEPLFDAAVDCRTAGSCLTLPVLLDGEVLAVLQVANHGPAKDELGRLRFTLEDQAAAAALALCVARRLLELRRAENADRAAATASVMAAIATTLYTTMADQLKLLEMVRGHVAALTHADKTLVYQPQGEARRLHAVLGTAAEISVPAGVGLVGAAAANREALRLDDAYAHPRFDRTVDSVTQYRTQSVLCVPLVCGGEVVAVVEAVNCLGHGNRVVPFRPADLQATVELCRFASVVWHSTVAFRAAKQKSQEELIIDQIAADLTETPLDVHAVDRLVRERVVAVCPCEHVALLLVDAETEELRGLVGEGPEVRLPQSAAFVPCETLRRREVTHLPDVSASRTFDPACLGYDSGCPRVCCVLCVPVLHRGVPVGAVQLLNRWDAVGRPAAFSSADLLLLPRLAAAMAPGLGHVLFLRRLQHETRQHARVADLLAAIPADTLSGRGWLASLRRHLQALVAAQRCTVMLVDFVTDTVECHGEEAAPAVVPLKSSHLLHHVVQTGEPVLVEDTRDDRRSRWTAEVAADRTVLSLIYVPVECQGAVVAAVRLVNRRGPGGQAFPFTRDDLRTVLAALRHSGPVFQLAQHQARLARETAERAVLSENMSRVAGSDLAEVANVMQATADVALSALRGEQCFVLSYERESRQLVSTPSMNTIRSDLVVELESVPGEAVVNREPLSLTQASEHPYLHKHDTLWGCATRCVLALPIYAHGAVVGALMVLNKTDGTTHFTKEDAEKLTLFGSSCASAIDNCTQFRYLRRQLGQALTVLDAMHDLLPTHRTAQLINYTESNFVDGNRPPPSTSMAIAEHEVQAYMDLLLSDEELGALEDQQFDIHHYRCAPAGSADRRQVVAVAFGLFAQSGVLQHFDLDPRTLVRFLLVVRDLYPPLPLHNFFFAVDVAQSACVLMRHLESLHLLTPQDKLVLLTAALFVGLSRADLDAPRLQGATVPLATPARDAATRPLNVAAHALHLLAQPHADIFESLPRQERCAAQRHLVGCLLAVAEARAGELHAEFEAAVQARAVTEERRLQLLLKAAEAYTGHAKGAASAQQWAIARADEAALADQPSGRRPGLVLTAEQSAAVAGHALGLLDFEAGPFLHLAVDWQGGLAFLRGALRQVGAHWERLRSEGGVLVRYKHRPLRSGAPPLRLGASPQRTGASPQRPGASPQRPAASHRSVSPQRPGASPQRERGDRLDRDGPRERGPRRERPSTAAAAAAVESSQSQAGRKRRLRKASTTPTS